MADAKAAIEETNPDFVFFRTCSINQYPEVSQTLSFMDYIIAPTSAGPTLVLESTPHT